MKQHLMEYIAMFFYLEKPPFYGLKTLVALKLLTKIRWVSENVGTKRADFVTSFSVPIYCVAIFYTEDPRYNDTVTKDCAVNRICCYKET